MDSGPTNCVGVGLLRGLATMKEDLEGMLL